MTKWAWQLVIDITHGAFSGSATSRLQPRLTAIQGVPLLTLTLTHKAFLNVSLDLLWERGCFSGELGEQNCQLLQE